MPLDSIRAGGAFVRAHGRHAISISTRPTRSVSADGCRKSGWLTTAFCRLSDGRVQNVWSVTVVYVRSVLVTKAQCVYIEAMHSFPLPSSLTQSSARPAKQEEAVRQEELDREREPLEVLRRPGGIRSPSRHGKIAPTMTAQTSDLVEISALPEPAASQRGAQRLRVPDEF